MLHTGWWPAQRVGDTAKVDNDGLDTVAFSFNLGLQPLHLVAVEGVGDILFPVLARQEKLCARK